MKRLPSLISYVVAFTAMIAVPLLPAHARRTERTEQPVPSILTGSLTSLDYPADVRRRLTAAAGTETTVLGTWDFDSGGNCSSQGWVSVDVTAATAKYFHVDDFAGLGGGDFGRLVPLEGLQSLWCGARPSATDYELCGYAALPGYGNSWDQSFITKNCLPVASDVDVTLSLSWDIEPGYDQAFPEFDDCNGNWSRIPAPPSGQYYPANSDILWDGWGNRTETITIPDSLHTGQIRFRVHFISNGAWSDEDGLWDTDGAIILDSLSVTDATGTVLPVEDFEDDAVGATSVQDWEAATPPGFGDFAGLVLGNSLVQEDPCVSNISCVWSFFNGSTYDYACGGFPNQPAMPYGNARGQFMDNRVESPWMPLMGSGDEFNLEFDVYLDLPLDNLQFFAFKIRSLVAGCPTFPRNDRQFYAGDEKEWRRAIFSVGTFIEPGATDIQVALHAIDQCAVWCGQFGSGDCHSHAPLFDNVEVYRVATFGPQWNVRSMDLFQDTFATDGTISPTSTGRADMARDINSEAIPAIRPGDSIMVQVNDPNDGLAIDPFTGFGAAVYMYVAVWPQGQAAKSGDALTQDGFRYPVVDNFTDAGGTQWYGVRMDTFFADSATRSGTLSNRFCVDLNDNLFTVGDTVCFYFCAESGMGSGLRSYWTPATGPTDILQDALDFPAEFQILPGGGYNNGGDILYVDGMDGRGAQPYFDTAFRELGLLDQVDRYDIRAPSSHVDNRPGSRVVNVSNQIIAPYQVIIWNTGNLTSGLIGDGLGNPEKSDDAYILFTFLDQRTSPGGVYFSGDDIADELYNDLLGTYINPLKGFISGAVSQGDHVAAGVGTSPLGIGESGSCFDHVTDPDTLVAYGGCPGINDFDIITPMGTATPEMSYNGNTATAPAVIAQTTSNTAGTDVGVVLSGFSFHEIREDRPRGAMARSHHLDDILRWLSNTPPSPPTGAGTSPAATALSQNYPNPFNPTTTIGFTLRERGHVSVRVFNVAGQLVNTLVDEVRSPGVSHSIDWDGRDARGSSVASGVYFYRLVTKDATLTRKMVMLK